MKYLLLLLLIGCASKVTREYECAIFNGHGVYAHVTVNAVDEQNATLTAEEVAERLMKQSIIPDNCSAMCSDIREYPRGK